MSRKPKRDKIRPGEENLTPEHRRDLERIREAKRKALKAGSRVDAVRAHCLECMGGKWGDVHDCPSSGCTLRPFRLGRRDPDTDIDPELDQ